MPKIEKLNNCSINVYGIEKGGIVPIFVSRSAAEEQIDIMWYEEHYSLIKDNKLMATYNKHKERKWVCRKCLHPFSREDLLINHNKDEKNSKQENMGPG